MAQLKAYTTEADIQRYLRVVGLPPSTNRFQLKKIDWKAFLDTWRQALHTDRYAGLRGDQREALHRRFLDVADSTQQLDEWARGLWETREVKAKAEARAWQRAQAKARAVDVASGKVPREPPEVLEARVRRIAEAQERMAQKAQQRQAGVSPVEVEKAQLLKRYKMKLKLQYPERWRAFIEGTQRGASTKATLEREAVRQQRLYERRERERRMAGARKRAWEGFGQMLTLASSVH